MLHFYTPWKYQKNSLFSDVFRRYRNVAVRRNVYKNNGNVYCIKPVITHVNGKFNPLSANPTKWSNTHKQFVFKLPTNCLSVFDLFVGLALKRLIYLLHHFTIDRYNFMYPHCSYSTNNPTPSGKKQDRLEKPKPSPVFLFLRFL